MKINSQSQYHLKGSLGGEKKKIDKSWSRLFKKKRTNKSIKFDMTKNDIITDITEITKNH